MLELVLAKLDELGADVEYFVTEDKKEVHVTLQDFEGFDDDWEEIDREYDDAEKVDAFEEWLEEQCEQHSGDFYQYFGFGDFVVVLGYASFDI